MWPLAALVLGALGCQTITDDGMGNKTVCLWRAWDYGFFTDGDDGEHTRRATPFLVVKVKPNMMIWSMLVQCKGVEAQATIKETVESSNRVAYPELILRSDTFVTLLKERFGVRGIAQAPPKYDSASVGMVENAIKQGKDKSANLGDCDALVARRGHGP